MKPGTKFLAREDVELLLRNWKELNASLLELPLEAVVQLLAAAVEKGVRYEVKCRLHQRYNVLRRERELEGLRKGILPWQISVL